MSETRMISKEWCVSDALWERMELLLPKRRRSRKGGRPPLSYRKVADGIFYVLRTGCQWKAPPRSSLPAVRSIVTFKPGPAAACFASFGSGPCSNTTT